jgi:hypothetical protein
MLRWSAMSGSLISSADWWLTPVGSYFGGRSGILGADDFARFEVARRPGRFAAGPEVHLYCGCKP